jgi:hypothetical protein
MLKEIALRSLREYAEDPCFRLEVRIGISPGGINPRGLLILFAGFGQTGDILRSYLYSSPKGTLSTTYQPKGLSAI